MLSPSFVVKPRVLRGSLKTAIRSAFIAALIVTGSSHLSAHAAEWPEFRGPLGNGVVSDAKLPVRWSESENIQWKVPIPGKGWSSPVVAEGRVYLTTAVSTGEDDASQSLQLLCLDADDGSSIWSTKLFQTTDSPEVEIHQKNSHASPTAVIEGNRIYVHFGPHGTACVDTRGKVVWTNTELKYLPQHGNGGSPALYKDRLIICCDGRDVQYAVALDKSNGKELWRANQETDATRGFSFCTPTVIPVEGSDQVICPASGAVFSYDPETGREIWRVDYDQGYSVVPRPVFGNGLIFVCSGFGDQQLFAIDPSGTGDVTDSHVVWKTKKGVPRSPSLLLHENHLFFVDDRGIASCLESTTGELHWQHRLGGGFSASPTYANGLIYFQNETGTTTVIQATDSYEEVAVNEIGEKGERTFASFAVIDDSILLRNETHLYRITDR